MGRTMSAQIRKVGTGQYKVAILTPPFEATVKANDEIAAGSVAGRLCMGVNAFDPEWSFQVTPNFEPPYYVISAEPVAAVPAIPVEPPTPRTVHSSLDDLIRERSSAYFTSKYALREDSPTRRFYTEATAEDVPALLRRLEAVQSLLTVTDDMVERAARASFESTGVGEWTWEDVLRDEPSRAQLWREDARAILVAALDFPKEI